MTHKLLTTLVVMSEASMSFWLNLLTLARRRAVAVPMVAAGIALAIVAFFVFPTVYTAKGTTVLTSSPVNQAAVAGDLTESPVTNPLVNFNDGLTTTLSILVQAMNTPEVLTDLGSTSGPTTVTVSDVGATELLGTKGPFMFVIGRSTASGDAARDIVERTMGRADQELLDRQRAVNAPPSQLITLLRVVSPTLPEASHSRQLAGAAAGFLLGIASVLLGCYWRAMRRRDRPEDTTARTDDGTAESEPVRHDMTVGGGPAASSRSNGVLPRDGERLNGHRPVVGDAEDAAVVEASTAGPDGPTVAMSSPHSVAGPAALVAPGSEAVPEPVRPTCPPARPASSPSPTPRSRSGSRPSPVVLTSRASATDVDDAGNVTELVGDRTAGGRVADDVAAAMSGGPSAEDTSRQR